LQVISHSALACGRQPIIDGQILHHLRRPGGPFLHGFLAIKPVLTEFDEWTKIKASIKVYANDRELKAAAVLKEKRVLG
jgi:hypothetical protein